MRRWWIGLAVAGVVLAACGDSDDNDAGDSDGGSTELNVVASFYPVAEAASRVGGDGVKVVNLTPAGTEPHDLELTPDQVDQLEDADLVIYLGNGFQPAVEAVAERREGPTLDLLAELDVSEGAIEALEAEERGAEEGEEAEEERPGEAIDPHFWLDPEMLSQAAEVIKAELEPLASADAAMFDSNLTTYQDQLGQLDGEFESALADCPRKEIVTSHAAFFYLTDRYGLTQVPIAGLSPESEPDAQRIADLTTLIQDRGITTVFYETLVAPDVAQTLAREASVQTAVLDPIEGLSQEDLTAGKDYSVVMRRNLAALQTALGCP